MKKSAVGLARWSACLTGALCALVVLASPLALLAQDDLPTDVPEEVITEEVITEFATDAMQRDGTQAAPVPDKPEIDAEIARAEFDAAREAFLAEIGLGAQMDAPVYADPWPIPALDEAARAALPSENAPADPAFMDSEWYLTPDEGGEEVAAAEDVAAAEMASPDIVGGSAAAPGEFPWQGVLLVNGGFNCGASLVHPRWVLTAAHCVTDPYSDGTWDAYPPSMLTVVMGDHTRSTTDGNEVYRGVVQVAVHPYYDANQIVNDVALLKLASPVPLSARIQTIAIATTAEQNSWANPGKWATVSGWGRVSTGGSLANSLLKASAPVITPAACSAAFAGINAITGDMICVGSGGTGSCNGDSGGPLVVPTAAGWRQVGIVSWGSSVCESRPSVYARAAYFRNWITGVMAPTFAPAIANPGFESGENNGWVTASNPGGIGAIGTGHATHAGSYSAWLGGATSLRHLIWQNVNLTDRSATLRFWYLVRSTESGCNADVGQVLVDGTVKVNIPLCSSNAAAGWREETVNLGATGRTSWIGFYTVNDSSTASSLYIDDVQVVTAAPAPAAVTSFSPATARDGDTVTLSGSGFFDVTKVAFGSVSAPFTVVSNTQLRVVVPETARSGKITVTSAGGTSTTAQNFTKIHTLTIRILGLGAGTLTRQGGGNLAHGARVDMADGASVTISASPTGSSTIQSWTAPCAGKTTSCTFSAVRSSVLTVVFDSPTAKRTYLSVVDK